MGILWDLIEAKAKVISLYGCLCTISSETDADPVTLTIQRMLAAERDHMAALLYLYNVETKEKADTSMTDFAREAVKDHREKNKLIK